MTRRACLLTVPFTARVVAADAAGQAYGLVTSAASYLSDGNSAGFIECFDPAMPGCEALGDQVRGLLQQCEVTSSIELRGNEGDDSARALELDWLLHLKLRYETGQVRRRREVVRCGVRKMGRKWKFVSFTPQALLAPMKV